MKKKKQASVGDIAAEIRLSFKSTSRHLSVLYAAGILEKEQKSLLVFYALTKQLHKATQEVLKHI